MTGGTRAMLVGVLLALIVVPMLLGDWDRDKWRHPKTAGALLWLSGGLIGYAIGVGPD